MKTYYEFDTGGVFRKVETDTELTFEAWRGGTWVEDNDLAGFILDPTPGELTVISESEAVSRWSVDPS